MCDGPPGLQDMFNAQIDKALKRKLGDSYTGTADDSCAKACVTKPPEGFGKFLIKFKEPKIDDIKEIYNKELLTKVCAFTNTTALCVRQCPETQRRTFLREVFAPIKYACEETDFVAHTDCYKENIEAMQPICMAADKCGPKKDAMTASFGAYKAAADKTKPVIEAMVGSFCELVDCGLDCGDARRIEKCGAPANTVLRGFYKKMVEAAEHTRYFSPRDFVIDVPASCNHIGH